MMTTTQRAGYAHVVGSWRGRWLSKDTDEIVPNTLGHSKLPGPSLREGSRGEGLLQVRIKEHSLGSNFACVCV